MNVYTEGSDNVFRDLGCDNPDEKLAKAQLALAVNKIIRQKGMTVKRAAEILGVEKCKVSELLNGKLSDFSIDILLGFLTSLEHRADIVVHSNKLKDMNKSNINHVHAAYA